jgi:hypothetical protein
MLLLELVGRDGAKAGKCGGLRGKIAKYLRLEILSGLCFLWFNSNSNSRFAIRNSALHDGTVFDIA